MTEWIESIDWWRVVKVMVAVYVAMVTVEALERGVRALAKWFKGK
jgi:hypothetical protein